MRRITGYITSLRPGASEAGVGAFEFGLVIAFIAVVIFISLTAIGTNLSTVFTKVASKLVT